MPVLTAHGEKQRNGRPKVGLHTVRNPSVFKTRVPVESAVQTEAKPGQVPVCLRWVLKLKVHHRESRPVVGN